MRSEKSLGTTLAKADGFIVFACTKSCKSEVSARCGLAITNSETQ